jgi:hypothetical protein
VTWLSTSGCTKKETALQIDGSTGADQATPAPGDLDGDGLDDALEDALAERFAPIVFHGERETTFPTNVDRWLALTDLYFVHDDGTPQLVAARPLTQAQLLGHTATVRGMTASSDGSRSLGKRTSFILGSVEQAADAGALQPSDWVTYVHSYPNALGGVTLQYWRAYVRNDASILGIDLSHGGDWEAIAVHLDRQQQPARVTYLDHAGIVDVTGAMKWEDSHPLVWSEEGGHSSHPDDTHSRSRRWFRQETRTGGTVTNWDSFRVGDSGGLRNVGEKKRPRNGQAFIQYSGLWGSKGRLFLTSGYWGPAFNETDGLCENGRPAYGSYLARLADQAECGRVYLKAWCDGADSTSLSVRHECYAASDVP